MRRVQFIWKTSGESHLVSDGLNLWIQRQLEPLSKIWGSISSEIFSWASLAVSLTSGAMLYSSAEAPWLALLAVPVIASRLLLDSLRDLSLKEHPVDSHSQILYRLCDRLSDISMFLGLSFWPTIRVHLAFLGIVSMLVVSYVGECGRSSGADCSGGLLCKTHRIALLAFFSMIYAWRPGVKVGDFDPFEVMFILFIPLASLTLLQRLHAAGPWSKDRE